MKHNLTADFLAIKTLSVSNSRKAIDEILKKYQKDYEWINSINKVPEGLRGLFCFKVLEAGKKKVKVIIESSLPDLKNITSIMPIRRYLNLCEKLEVLLNNAIEAASESQDKYIKIEIEKPLKNKLKIKILNTFNNKIDVSKIGQKEYSTKMRNSGFGLYSIIKHRSENIKATFKIIDNIYIVTLIINLKNKKSY
jgi:two-component system sensor histidine kinase AgrC